MNLKPMKSLHMLEIILFILFYLRPDHVSASLQDVLKVISIDDTSVSFTLERSEEWQDNWFIMYTFFPFNVPFARWGAEDDFKIPENEIIKITYNDLTPLDEYSIKVKVFGWNAPQGPIAEKIFRTPMSCYFCNKEKNNRECSIRRNRMRCQSHHDGCMNVVEYSNGIPSITKSCVNRAEQLQKKQGCLGKVEIGGRAPQTPRNGICICVCESHMCNKQILPCVSDFSVQVGATTLAVLGSELETTTNYVIEIILLPWNQLLRFYYLRIVNEKTFNNLFPASNYIVRVTPINSCLQRSGPSIEKRIRTSQLCFSCAESKNNSACSGMNNTEGCSLEEDACLNVIRRVNGSRLITKRCAKWDPNYVNVTSNCLKRTCTCTCRGNLCNEGLLPCLQDITIEKITSKSITYRIPEVGEGDKYLVFIQPIGEKMHQLEFAIEDFKSSQMTINYPMPGMKYRTIFQHIEKGGVIGRREQITAHTLLECYVCEESDRTDCKTNIMKCPIGMNICLERISSSKTHHVKVTKRCAFSVPSIPSSCRREFDEQVCYHTCTHDLCNPHVMTNFREEDYLYRKLCDEPSRTVRKRIPSKIKVEYTKDESAVPDSSA